MSFNRAENILSKLKVSSIETAKQVSRACILGSFKKDLDVNEAFLKELLSSTSNLNLLTWILLT